MGAPAAGVARMYLASNGTGRRAAVPGHALEALPSDAPMKISLVSPGFPPQLGGVEVVVGHLADALCEHGHQVTVYAQRPRGSSFPASHDYSVRRFADWTGSGQFPVAPGLARALWRDRGLSDVIHAHSFHAVPAMMAATVPKVPLVFTPHFHAVGHTRTASAVHTVYDPLATLLCPPCRQGDLRFGGRVRDAAGRGVIRPWSLGCPSFRSGWTPRPLWPPSPSRPIVRSSWSLGAWNPTSASTRPFGHSRLCVRTHTSLSAEQVPTGRALRAPCPGAGDNRQGLLSMSGQRRGAAPLAAHGHLNLEPVGKGGFRSGGPGGGRGGQPSGGFRYPCPCRTSPTVGGRGYAHGCRDARCGRGRSHAGHSSRDGNA